VASTAATALSWCPVGRHTLKRPKWVLRVVLWLFLAFMALFVGTIAALAGASGGIVGLTLVGVFLVSIIAVMYYVLKIEISENLLDDDEDRQHPAEEYYSDYDVLNGHDESATQPLYNTESLAHRRLLRQQRRRRRLDLTESPLPTVPVAPVSRHQGGQYAHGA